jgi:hypothetical protein
LKALAIGVGEVVQGLWIGPRLSTMERLSILSFLKNGHPYHLYAYDAIEGVPDGTVLMPAEAVLPRDRIFKYANYDSYAGFSNVFSYEALYAHGGYWADLDMVCLRPLDLETPYVFAGERQPGGRRQANKCLMKAPRGSEVMRRAREVAGAKDVTQLEWGDTGPRLITELVHELGLQQYVVPPTLFCPIDFWEIYRFVSSTALGRLRARWKLSRRTYAVHLWNEGWRRRKQDKDASYHPKCLYEQWKARYLSGEPQA